MVKHGGGGMVAITYIFAIIIVRIACYVLHDAQRSRRRGGVRHHARRRRRRGGDSVRTSRALRSDSVRTGRSISLNTLITAATLNIWRYEKNVILKTNSTQNINFIHISLIHHDIPIHPDPTLKIPAVYILHTFANEHWGIFCQNLAVRQFFLDFLSTNVISATWVSHCTLFVSLSKWDENVYSLT